MNQNQIINAIRAKHPEFDIGASFDDSVVVLESHFMEGEFRRIEIHKNNPHFPFSYSWPVWDDDHRSWVHNSEEIETLEDLLGTLKMH